VVDVSCICSNVARDIDNFVLAVPAECVIGLIQSRKGRSHVPVHDRAEWLKLSTPRTSSERWYLKFSSWI
jgi:hypothetical protein